MKKKCIECETVKPFTAFKEREDGWGLYAWCDDCRSRLGRLHPNPESEEFINKTGVFNAF